MCFLNSPLHVYFLPARLLIFQKFFPPARLFWPARLLFFKNFPACTFISYCTSIRYTRVHTFINSGYCVSEHAYLSFMLFSICMLLRGFACLDMHIKSLFVLWRKLCSDTQKNGRCFCQSMTVLFRCTINLVKSIYFICNFLYSLYFLTRLFLSPL